MKKDSKEDPNYIAKLEKAISKKYGKEAIQNPKGNWDEEKEKHYLEQLEEFYSKFDKNQAQFEKIEVNGFFVPKKLFNKENKRTCPVCDVYSFKMEDDIYMTKYECCEKCFIKYVEGREKKWLDGWRPDKGEIKCHK